MNPIRVAAGVIYNSAGKILLAQRPTQDKLANLWEFPGGKIEAGETPAQALLREIDEEFTVLISEIKDFLITQHSYPSATIELVVMTAKCEEENLKMTFHQNYRWVSLTELKDFDMAAADHPVIDKLIKQQ